MKYLFSLISCILASALCCQTMQVDLDFSITNEPFESIAKPERKLVFDPFDAKKVIKNPVDIFVEGLGKIDSLSFSGNKMILGKEIKAEKVIWTAPILFGDSAYDDWNSDKYYFLKTDPEKVALYEYHVYFPDFPNDTLIYQIQFNETRQTIAFHYKKYPFPNDNPAIDFSVTLEVYDDIRDELLWIFALVGDPLNPQIQKKIEFPFEYLDTMPPPNTKYIFGNLVSSVGDHQLRSQSRVEYTQNGFRFYSPHTWCYSLPAAFISGPYEVHPGRQLLCFWKKEIIGPVGLSLFECSALQIG